MAYRGSHLKGLRDGNGVICCAALYLLALCLVLTFCLFIFFREYFFFHVRAHQDARDAPKLMGGRKGALAQSQRGGPCTAQARQEAVIARLITFVR